MPFTLAHPAAVLPLPRLMGRLGVFSALVIGSIAPDLPYFIGDPFKRSTTHSLLSVFWFSLPVGWATYLVFEHAMRRAIVFVLPAGFRARLRRAPQQGDAAAVSLCIAIGALTHIGWDALTHELGSYALLQMVSTLGGLGLVGLTTWRWFERTPARTLPAPSRALEYRRFVARILVSATFLCTSPVAGIWIAMSHAGSDTHPVVLGGHALLTGLGCSALLLTFGGVWLNRGGLKA